jgi:hypothetical protein
MDILPPTLLITPSTVMLTLHSLLEHLERARLASLNLLPELLDIAAALPESHIHVTHGLMHMNRMRLQFNDS